MTNIDGFINTDTLAQNTARYIIWKDSLIFNDSVRSIEKNLRKGNIKINIVDKTSGALRPQSLLSSKGSIGLSK